LPPLSAAQVAVAVNRNARYLFAADPGDARSIWVNPGALGLTGTLSVNADLTFGLQSPYDDGSPLSQLSLGFSSHFLAFAYQFDRLADPLGSGIVHGHTYRLALWGEDRRLGAGGAVTLYRGGDGGVAYDFGVVYRAGALLDLGAVLANVGQPSVRGMDLRAVGRPAATVHAGDVVAFQAQGELGSDRIHGYAFGVRLRLGSPKMPLQLNVRLDTDRALRRQTFALGLTVGGENRGAAVLTTSGDFKDSEAVSLHGISERSRSPSRHR